MTAILLAQPGDRTVLEALLAGLNLPTAGLDGTELWVASDHDALLGVAGLEVHGTVGLLRSVAVSPVARSRGIAAGLVSHVIGQARAQGLSDLYLLTTTAAAYFPRFGFRPLARAASPADLNASREFQDACPASAALLHLPLKETTMTATALPIPGTQDATRTDALLDTLRRPDSRPLEFWLHGAPLVGPGYHVTEVKAVSIEAMDCGGRAASWRETVIQLMDGSPQEAREGFMSTAKFLGIYDRVVARVPVRPEAEVRFEYGTATSPALQYHVSHVEEQPERLIVHLRTPGVQCKAGDACGVPAEAEAQADACAPGSGCCGPQVVQLG
ncbi:arsenic resistance N-acetyltransferase ArsN2 [uncultured Deinococcus sp.]|uniref:arsenic resistance N-acetyltransferase ArsN2 n=1 Tax=uncultured Deinococcus sp. TaxID=158789 RepID=UPI0025DF6597|nr:arsenic resistance N-acetyltransferase ArsN2 [uncultured Deinococcus sp.]